MYIESDVKERKERKHRNEHFKIARAFKMQQNTNHKKYFQVELFRVKTWNCKTKTAWRAHHTV